MFSGIGDAVKEIFSGKQTSAQVSAEDIKNYTKLFYEIKPGNWYQTFPYFFEIRRKINNSQEPAEPSYNTFYRFFLPIPPQNMTVQDMSTSEAHATLGGVVEETTEGVFSLITLVGTTGMSTSQTSMFGASTDLNPQFRQYLEDLTGQSNPITKALGGVINFGANAVAGLTGIGDTATLPYSTSGSAVPSSNLAGAEATKTSVTDLSWDLKAQTIGGFGSSFLDGLNKIGESLGISSVNTEKYRMPFSNGFAWSHALRQFFLIYQRMKSESPDFSLHFFDAKANASYRCVVRAAQFNQNAQNPYVITYNISLKCWNISSLEGQSSVKAVDRFAPGGDLEAVNTANLTATLTNFGNTIRNFQRPESVAGSMTKSSTSSFI